MPERAEPSIRVESSTASLTWAEGSDPALVAGVAALTSDRQAPAVVVHDDSGQIVAANGSAADVLVMSVDQLLGRTSRDPRWEAITEYGVPLAAEHHPAMRTLSTAEPVSDFLMGVHVPAGSDPDNLFRAKTKWIRIDSVPVIRDSRLLGVVARFEDASTTKRACDAGNRVIEAYRLLLRDATDVVYRTDSDGVIQWVSQGLTRMLGYAPDEVIGRPGSSLLHPDDAGRARPGDGLGREGESAPYRVRMLAKDGSIRWVEVTRHASVEGDRVIAHVGGGRDVTGEMRALAARDESESRFRLLLDNSADVVYLLDPSGHVTWISPSLSESLGWDPDEMVGSRMYDLVHPDDRPALDADREAGLRGEEVAEPVGVRAFRLRRKDGSYTWMSLKSTQIRDDDGRMIGIVIGLRDIAELVAERESAKSEAARRQAIMETLLDPHVLLEAVRDETGRIVDFVYADANQAACEYNRTPREQLLGMRLLTLLPNHAEGGLLARYADVVESGKPLVLNDFAYSDPNLPANRRYDIRAIAVGDSLSFSWRDVTDRFNAAADIAESEERYRLLAENSSDVVLRTRDNAVVWVSPGLTRALGWQPEDWIGRSMADFGYAEDREVVEDGRQRMMGGAPVVMRLRLADVAGGFHWVELHAQLYRGPDGIVDGIQSSFRVVDDVVRAEELLLQRAVYDDLTGTLKRDPAMDRLQEIGHRTRVPGEETAVLFIDVDEFKAVNDTWGHAAGDVLLRSLADRIRSMVRGEDNVARVGGDEFLVTLGRLHSLEEAVAVAEKIRLACAEPVDTVHGTVTSTLSIGVTLADPVESGDELMARADKAMYAAKRAGRNRVVAVPPRSGRSLGSGGERTDAGLDR